MLHLNFEQLLGIIIMSNVMRFGVILAIALYKNNKELDELHKRKEEKKE